MCHCGCVIVSQSYLSHFACLRIGDEGGSEYHSKNSDILSFMNTYPNARLITL